MSNYAIIASIIFVLVYAVIIGELLPRTIITLSGAVLLFILGIVKETQVVSLVNWDAMGLILGMFIIVHVLVKGGFFDFVSTYIVKMTRGNPFLIFFSLSFFTGILAAFMDSISVMLFMATLSISISEKLDTDPVPFVLSQITASNLGGSSTLMGDPPNIIIGTGLGISLAQFLANLTPLVFLLLILNGFLFTFVNMSRLKKAKVLDAEYINNLEPSKQIKDYYMFLTGIIVFALVVVLLFTHNKFGIPVGNVGIIGAALLLFLNGHRVEDIWENIDWEVLIFFITLFVIVGSLEVTGVIHILAGAVIKFTKGSIILTKVVLLFSSSFLSAFIDNVPFAASMVPLIKSLASKVSLSVVSMALITAFGTDVGGSMTPIGASANVVGLSILKSAGIEVTWKDYITKVAPITIVELILAGIFFLVFYH
ncbi:MAG: anion permease [Caldisericaceae bacterium]